MSVAVCTDRKDPAPNLLGAVLTRVLYPGQMDYRCLVHEKDEAVYREMKTILLDIRGFYVSLLQDRGGGGLCLVVVVDR